MLKLGIPIISSPLTCSLNAKWYEELLLQRFADVDHEERPNISTMIGFIIIV
jgi:hypothetical protein